MSLTPEFCRIVAVGWVIGDAAPESSVDSRGTSGAAEVEILRFIWRVIQDFSPIVGFNVIGFDLQVIRARSILLGVEPSRMVNDSPWGNRDVVDLMLARFGRSGKAMPMKRLAKLYGIPVPAGDIDGSQVSQLWQAGKYEKIGEYVRSDIAVTRELHRRWSGYFCL